MNSVFGVPPPKAYPGVRMSQWAGWLLLSALGAWLGYGLIRVALFAAQAWGAAALTDGMVLFRLAETLVILPAAAYLLVLGNSPERKTTFLRTARWVIWAGALLAALGVWSMWKRIAWAPFGLVFSLLGLGLPFILSSRRGWVHRGIGRGMLVLSVLAHLLTLGLAFIMTGYSYAPYPAPLPPLTTDRDERWRQDVHYLGTELVRMHTNAFHTVSSEAYWNRVTALEESIPQRSDAQIAIEMMGIVASIGDAHTNLSLGRQNSLDGYPLNMRWYSDGLYITGISPLYPDALGARVLKIGSLSSEEAYQRSLPLVAYENESWARMQSANLLHIMEVLSTIGAIDKPGPAVFTLQHPDGSPFSVEIALLTSGQTVNFMNAATTRPYYRSRQDPFWFEYRPATRTLYFRYARCTDPAGFARLNNDLWKLVDEKPVDRLVIDLRGNSGGNSIQFERLFLPRLEKHPTLNAPDRLFVLIDNGTFSSAVDNAIALRQNTKATFAGQPTGGRPNSYGEVRSFQLPNSHMSVYYSTKYFQAMDTDPPAFMPDMLIDLPAADAFQGKDPVLEKIIPEETW